MCFGTAHFVKYLFIFIYGIYKKNRYVLNVLIRVFIKPFHYFIYLFIYIFNYFKTFHYLLFKPFIIFYTRTHTVHRYMVCNLNLEWSVPLKAPVFFCLANEMSLILHTATRAANRKQFFEDAGNMALRIAHAYGRETLL